MKARLLYSAIVVSALVPGGGRIAAQEATTVVPALWTSSFEYIGIENLRCNCTFRSVRDENGRMFVFRSEPMVTGVISGTPAAGLLMRGDTITQIDGLSILSVEGARRFSNIRPGDDVNFQIRRRGRVMKVVVHAAADTGHRVYTVVTPEVDGWNTPPFPPEPALAPAPGVARSPRPPRTAPTPRVFGGGPGVFGVPSAVPAEPSEPAMPALPAIPTGPATPAPRALRPGAPWVAAIVPTGAPSPDGWFGFSIRCNDCGWATSGRPGESPVWESDNAPEIAAIANGSPADRAGLKAGDRITHIDGISILTREGQRRFGRVKPRQTVRLTVQRDGKSMTKEMRLATRPEYRPEVIAMIAATPPTPRAAPRAPVPPSMRRELRYSGKLENVTIEVFSPGGPTVERVGDTMIITTGASVVRIKVDPKTTR